MCNFLDMKAILLILTMHFILQSSEQKAWIDHTVQNDRLSVQGKFLNQRTEADTLRYELTTVRQGKAGNTQSKQAGQFVAPTNEEVVITKTSVSIQSDDTYTIRLKIFRGDTVYMQDQVVH